MKKQILVLCVVLVMGVTGCGSQKAAETEISKETTQQSSSVEETTEEVTIAEELVKRENTNFRNACWGDDVETVKKYEEEKLEAEEDSTLTYSTKVSGYDMYAIYCFDNNGKLYKGMYGFKNKYSNAGQYIPQYQALRDSLKEKYGEPGEDDIIPLQKQSQIDYSGEANALKFGYVAYRATWNDYNGTKITIGMMAQDYEIGIFIEYIDVNYKEDVNNSGL
ncbi:MAG: hypothetical protein LBS02_17900 [Hungatella sp.]|jgi:hypothetical protein|nr:hypothetical protein [Hungatella sp.]